MWWFQLKLNSAQNSFGFSCCVLGVFILSYFFVKKKVPTSRQTVLVMFTHPIVYLPTRVSSRATKPPATQAMD